MWVVLLRFCRRNYVDTIFCGDRKRFCPLRWCRALRYSGSVGASSQLSVHRGRMLRTFCACGVQPQACDTLVWCPTCFTDRYRKVRRMRMLRPRSPGGARRQSGAGCFQLFSAPQSTHSPLFTTVSSSYSQMTAPGGSAFATTKQDVRQSFPSTRWLSAHHS